MPIHSAVFVALGCLFLTVLAALTSRLRRKYGIFVGYGDRPELQRMSRAHGVSLEHLLPMLLLLLILELCGCNRTVVDAFGVVILASRLVHVLGSLLEHSRLKIFGISLTYGTEAALGIAVLAQAARVA
jgi:uncharacterized protein